MDLPIVVSLYKTLSSPLRSYSDRARTFDVAYSCTRLWLGLVLPTTTVAQIAVKLTAVTRSSYDSTVYAITNPIGGHEYSLSKARNNFTFRLAAWILGLIYIPVLFAHVHRI